MRSQIMNVRISNMPHFSEKSSPLPSFSHFCYYSRNVFYWVGGYSPPTPLGRTTGPAPIAKNLIFCSHDCFDTCRPGGQPKVFPLDPLILFGDSTSCGRKGAGSAEGEPWVCPLPGRCRKKSKPEFEIPAQGAGPGWGLPRGVGGEKPPTLPEAESGIVFLHFHVIFS